jgi:hypothetical protein
MFTIGTELKEYPAMWLAMAAAYAWMREAHRSVTIYQDGKPMRFLRY